MRSQTDSSSSTIEIRGPVGAGIAFVLGARFAAVAIGVEGLRTDFPVVPPKAAIDSLRALAFHQSKQRLYSSQDLFGIEGLVDIVIRAEPHALNNIGKLRL